MRGRPYGGAPGLRETGVGRNWRQKFREAWAGMAAARRERRRAASGVALADGRRRQSDWTAAIEGYRKYLRRHPRDLGVRIRLIRTLYSAGRFDEADAELAQARAARPDKAELSDLAADLLAARAASIPVADYNRFRRDLRIPAPPVGERPIGDILVIVDGSARASDMIEITLASLRRSAVQAERVIVWSDEAETPPWDAALVLMIQAGTILDPEALGWLSHALAVTGAVAAYGDDDRAVGQDGEAEGDWVWSDPAFHAAPHPLDLGSTPRVPAAILFDARARPGPAEASGSRAALTAAFGVGPVAHVPLLLAARCVVERPAPEGLAPDFPEAQDVGILAIVPTRDEGAVLSTMIDSLETLAARRDRLEIMVVNNGSRDPETLALLERLRREGRIRVLSVDEPFNWSRLNNLAAAGAGAEILLFANNDVQMLTEGWDDRLRQSLLQPGVGVVGARLVYPNGRVQHAGMALGALDGRPLHEGLGASHGDGGPLDRWRRNRPAAAVTGAFMGVRREAFEQVGGFNAVEFAVGCNDIDFCLRVRKAGWLVFYAADLELIHLESHSRGHDDDEMRRWRAQRELDAMFRIWGDEAARDPGRNPHWVNHETQLFHGLRQPDREVIETWIARSTDLWHIKLQGG